MDIILTENINNETKSAFLVNGMTIEEFWDTFVCKGVEYFEPIIENNYIHAGYTLYINEPFMLKDIIEATCYFEQGEEDYDIISNSGYGETSSYMRRSIVGKEGVYTISKSNINDVEIKPISEFESDFPNFNRENYFALMDALDNFYN